MLAPIHVMFIVLLFFTSLPHAIAITVQDEQGSFTLDTVPQRVVVLELSFADALAAINISPVGIADDNDPQRILSDVRQRIKPWQSTALAPSQALKPSAH